ncbi:hypothetical protein BGZ75_001328 [Mortierella antarctica]|nr:hypothetical protein BGZ75_001328 [Mortierella antarctica]
MASTSPPTTSNDINNLREQLAQRARQMAQLQASHIRIEDPQIERQQPSTVFHPSDKEAKRYPPIRPSDALSFYKGDVLDDDIWEQLHKYPKNSTMGYEPPNIPSIIQSSKTGKAHDNQLRTIQKRLVHLTHPIDIFLHDVWSLEEDQPLDRDDVVLLCENFAILVRDQLGAMAGRITNMRLDNLKAAQGATFKQDALDLVDPQKFQEEVKSLKTIANAFKPRQASQYQRQNSDASGDSRRSHQKSSRQYQDSRGNSRRDHNNIRRRSFQRDRSKQRGNSQHRGRSSSRRKDRSPESEGGSNDS